MYFKESLIFEGGFEIISEVTSALNNAILLSDFDKPLVLLTGEMGSGKTTFVGNYVRKFSENVLVNSPTFNILNVYEFLERGKGKKIFHFDFYRITKENNFVLGEFGEYFFKEGICFIEWWENIQHSIQNLDHMIQLKIIPQSMDIRKYILSDFR